MMSDSNRGRNEGATKTQRHGNGVDGVWIEDSSAAGRGRPVSKGQELQALETPRPRGASTGTLRSTTQGRWPSTATAPHFAAEAVDDPFLNRVRGTIAEYRMIDPGDGIVVAVSGGADSVALLVALGELRDALGIELHVAHLDHGLRGAESDDDATWVAALSAQLGLHCTVERADLDPQASNLEERARDVRYSFLERVAARLNFTKVATGHTRDDQTETVLMRTLRGAGLEGQAGIRAVRDGKFIRPLFDCDRQDIIEFLGGRGIAHREDRSNLDRRFLRNRIRHQVLPRLEKILPGIRERMVTRARVAVQELDGLAETLKQPLASAMSRTDGSCAVEALRQLQRPVAAHFVRRWLQQVRGDLRQLNEAHIDSILHIVLASRPNARVVLPKGALVVREYSRLRYLPALPVAGDSEAVCLAIGDSLRWGEDWRISGGYVPPTTDEYRDKTQMTFVADADLLGQTLQVRSPRRGDAIQSIGMSGHIKLQDLFVNRKIPWMVRKNTPVLESAGEIVWVPGVGRGTRALVSPATIRMIRLVATHVGIAGA